MSARVFIYFLNDEEVGGPRTINEWRTVIELAERSWNLVRPRVIRRQNDGLFKPFLRASVIRVDGKHFRESPVLATPCNRSVGCNPVFVDSGQQFAYERGTVKICRGICHKLRDALFLLSACAEPWRLRAPAIAVCSRCFYRCQRFTGQIKTPSARFRGATWRCLLSPSSALAGSVIAPRSPLSTPA
jgi:hypothetical protein